MNPDIVHKHLLISPEKRQPNTMCYLFVELTPLMKNSSRSNYRKPKGHGAMLNNSQECNQQNTDCGKFYRTNDQFSSASNSWTKDESKTYRLKETLIYQPIATCFGK